MDKNNVININNQTEDYLTDFLRSSAQKMLQVAIEEEVKSFVEGYSSERLSDGRSRIVRNGYLPERDISTGIGKVAVKVPRVRDRITVTSSTHGRGAEQFSGNVDHPCNLGSKDLSKVSGEEKVAFYPSWIPRYMRRSVSLDNMLPLLYLKGISTNDFSRVLEPILGKNASNISPSVICRMKSAWSEEYNQFLSSDLSKKQYVYWWADGIYLSARMEEEKNCMLVIIGADANGNKELVGLYDGLRESKESWLSLMRDLNYRGLRSGPKLAIGDGGLGFWAAIGEVYPKTEWQRCWVHKTRNILDKLPKSLNARAKSDLYEISGAETKKDALKAFKKFILDYGAKYPKAVDCLRKDKYELLAFYSYPAEHWISIRTTNPIESTFATVRHRTVRSKGCFSRETIVSSVFKLIKEAEKSWRKLAGHKRMADVINMVKFVDGIAEKDRDDQKKIQPDSNLIGKQIDAA